MKDAKDIAEQMNKLNIWKIVEPYNWAIKPFGSAIPYFCSPWVCNNDAVAVRFFLLEGWQTIHDFVRIKADPNFGFYSSPMELPHFEVVYYTSGKVAIFRHDPGYTPRFLTENENKLVSRLLWEAYGVMMRIEGDQKLALRYSDERAMFARVETSIDKWEDAPLAIPKPRAYVERVAFEKKDIAVAKDLPIDEKAICHFDFDFDRYFTPEKLQPRLVYILRGKDSVSKEEFLNVPLMVSEEVGLKELWESIPSRILKVIIERGKIPGEVRVTTPRLFRLMRPLCEELPFKLSIHSEM